MKFRISNKVNQTEAYIIFAAQPFTPDSYAKFPKQFADIINSADISFFSGKLSETAYIFQKEKIKLILCGLGSEDKINSETLRIAGATAISECKKRKLTSCQIVLSTDNYSFKESAIILPIAEGMFLSDYSFDKYKAPDPSKVNINNITFITNDKQILSALNEIETVCKNTLLCRDLVNESSYSCTPQDIEGIAVKICNSLKIKIKVFDEKQLTKSGLGLLLAVSKGSDIPPRLIVMTYTGNSKSKDSLAFIGKGITFDSGGINYKPSAGLDGMRRDMAGAASVIYTLKTAAELKLKKNIVGVIPLSENMLSNKSFRPGDVYYSYSKKSVEIGNTDAEGRLILADAIEYTLDKIKPSLIIDIATLTGACAQTFGETIAAVLSNDEELTNQLVKSSKVSGETLWPMPIFTEHEENMKSDIADISNMSQEKNAGTIHAAAFLKSFVKDTPWAHIDIAGTAWNTKARNYKPKYATGFGVRLLIEFVKGLK